MKILFCSYGGGHVTAILPVLKVMKERGHECLYLALTTAGSVAERAETPHVKVIDYVDMADPHIQLWGNRLAQRHHTDGKGITRDQSIAYLGTLFCDLAQEIGEDAAWERYERDGLNAFCPVRFMRDVLQKEQPDVVVATNSPRMEKAALRAAYQLGIPSLCMVDLFGLLEESWLSRPDNGHVVSVARPDVANRLVAAGRKREDIFLTGSPIFDQLVDPSLPVAGRKWREERGVAPDDVLIFWAEQPEPSNPELPRCVRNHLADVCQKNGWKLVVRLHPSSTDASKEVLPDGVLQSHAHEPLAHVIHACDVGVTLTSTVGWELLLSSKPLLVMTISCYSNVVTYGQDDGALAVPSLDDAEQGLKTLLFDPEESARLAALRDALPKPGLATENVCRLIEKEVLARTAK
ncbi:hypothetical protein [Halodesulfovibrio sp.]|jgi:hypothetical protein|uniref:hypothetical protein n=1 Tax=Halodesulfovibrio sp. TaxID=1912772 RepID=UPI0025F9EC3F|nr:hypothetical protein [Halodesulfovibrio sp.]MCT4626537.1 hypothetical protein [Halodesulfovibrio sp.]